MLFHFTIGTLHGHPSMILCRFAFVLAAVSSVSQIYAADAKTGFIDKVFKDADGEHPYVVYIPAKHSAGNQSPIILFLHGAGETKGGSKQPVEVGVGPAIKTREKSFPFIVVIPQSEKRTWKADSDDGKRALAMLDVAAKEYNADAKRTYLTGLSMGGFGTWSIAAAYPDKWAAVAPICGGGDPATAEKLKNLPIWCFHGDADTIVNVDKSRVMVKAVEAAGGKPKYTEYPGVMHNSWDKAYGNDELYTWFLANKKK